MAVTLDAAVEKKILAQINSGYLHDCSDVEATKATDFCTLFENKYGHKKDELKGKFVHIESVLAGCGINLSAPQTMVVEYMSPSVPSVLSMDRSMPWPSLFLPCHLITLEFSSP